jgi:hypothetical protein
MAEKADEAKPAEAAVKAVDAEIEEDYRTQLY